MITQPVYFDHNATTLLSPEALLAMSQVYQFPYNTSAVHQLGNQANKLVNEARKNLQNLLNAHNYEVIFTSGSTEATNTVFNGIKDVSDILFSTIEHSSVFNCRPYGKKITEIASNQHAIINISDLQEKLPKHSNFLVSAMLANNETGSIQPVAEIAKIVHQKSGLIHCDIVQAVGKIKVDLEELNVDFASVSAHKFGGPQGVGALLVRKGLDIEPLILGSKQEKGKRAGSLNVAGIVGFAVACQQAQENLVEFAKISGLIDKLQQGLKTICGDNLQIFSQEVPRIANTLFFSVAKQNSQIALIHCDLHNICLSAGSACSSGSINQSRILKALATDAKFWQGGLRISLGLSNTQEEIDYFLNIYQQFYQLQQKLCQ